MALETHSPLWGVSLSMLYFTSLSELKARLNDQVSIQDEEGHISRVQIISILLAKGIWLNCMNALYGSFAPNRVIPSISDRT